MQFRCKTQRIWAKNFNYTIHAYLLLEHETKLNVNNFTNEKTKFCYDAH
jgi:hypothetical protein